MGLQVLFVCTGNICRSAFAERYSRLTGNPAVTFTSAGVGAVVGAPIDTGMAEELTARGGDASAFSARQLTLSLITAADLVLTMETSHRAWVLEEMPAAVTRTFTLGQARQSLAELPPGLDALTYLGSHRQRPRRRDDIADPYRRGRDAMAFAATEISASMDAILPPLLP